MRSLGELGEQVAEAHALLGVEARGRLVDDDERRVVEQRLRDADALAHAAREAAERAGAPTSVRLTSSSSSSMRAAARAGQPLQAARGSRGTRRAVRCA